VFIGLERQKSICLLMMYGNSGDDMSREASTDPSVAPSHWHNVTLALLGGLAVASILFAHIAVVQTPGLDPPPQTAALFIVAATIATIGYLLVKQGSASGYLVGILTGVVILAEIALVVGGAYGDAGPETNPIGPGVYILLSVAVVITSTLAWRSRTRIPTTDTPTTTR
jgi:peptidoglycan/LPS O-acetylase OafA/YrhL